MKCKHPEPRAYCKRSDGCRDCEELPSAASAGYAPGDRVRLLKNIWDCGEDHHPACCLARKGEVLVVRSGTGINGGHLAVSHEHITDRAFSVYAGEYERA